MYAFLVLRKALLVLYDYYMNIIILLDVESLFFLILPQKMVYDWNSTHLRIHSTFPVPLPEIWWNLFSSVWTKKIKLMW